MTIWGWNPGYSSLDYSESTGAIGYVGTTFHFVDLAPDNLALSDYSNPYLNSLTLTNTALSDFGFETIAELNSHLDNLNYQASLLAVSNDDFGYTEGNFTVGRIDDHWYLNIHQEYSVG